MKFKRIFLAAAFGLTMSATKALAVIGWSTEECIQHWGKPQTSTVESGTGDMNFDQKFLIHVMLENDKVFVVTYLKLGMTDQDFYAIRLAEGKDWTFLAERSGKQYWTLNDDLLFVRSGTDNKLLGTIDMGMILHRKDLQRVTKILGVQPQ